MVLQCTLDTIEFFNIYDNVHNENDYDDLVCVIQMSRSASNYVPETFTVGGIREVDPVLKVGGRGTNLYIDIFM